LLLRASVLMLANLHRRRARRDAQLDEIRNRMMRMVLLSITLAAVSNGSRASTEALAAGEVEVVGMDYAFKVPRELPSGRTVFRFRNDGKVRHELNIALLTPGATVQQFIAAANASKPLGAMIDAPVGVLFAKPGQRSPSALSTELRAGRTYVVLCIFKDSAAAPKHHALGMFSEIHVTAEKSVASTAVRVDTIVGTDYAFRYPLTLAPGWHRLAFVNVGKQRHEMAVALLRKGVTLQQIAEVDKKGGDVEPFFEQNFGLLHSPGGTSPLGVLELQLLPGRDYVIECGFSDTDKSPPHYMLGMTGLIRVTGKPAG
jgi:hypothetical protein